MAPEFPIALLIVCICASEVRFTSAAADEVDATPEDPKIECGDTPEVPVNVTYSGGHVAGLYAVGRLLECYSQRVVRHNSYLHIIYNVFGRDCGGNVSSTKSSIGVRLQHYYSLVVAGDTVHVLTCSYAKRVLVTHAPVGIRDPAFADDPLGSANDGKTSSSTSAITPTSTPPITTGKFPDFDDFDLGLFDDDAGPYAGEGLGDGGGGGAFVVGDRDSNTTAAVPDDDTMRGDGSWFGFGDNAGGQDGVNEETVPETDPNLYFDDASLAYPAGSSQGTALFNDNNDPGLKSNGTEVTSDDHNAFGGDSSLSVPGNALPGADYPVDYPNVPGDDPTLPNTNPDYPKDQNIFGDDSSLGAPENGPLDSFLPFNSPGFDPFNPVSSSLGRDAQPPGINPRPQGGRSRPQDDAAKPKYKPGHKPDATRPDVMLPSPTPAPSHSVLQLNLIDEDGGLTAVVYPGKPVALELNSAHQSPFGKPVVRNCKVTNPLQKLNGVPEDPFSEEIVQDGCGVGSPLRRSAGFRRGRQGYITPFFAVSPSWVQQETLLFACEVILCSDLSSCKQVCPPSEKHKLSKGEFDLNVTLDSQVVTSCPSQDQIDTVALLPECLPKGNQLPVGSPSPDAGEDKNQTDPLLSDGSVDIKETSTSWLAQHLHYVIIICVLVLLIVVFMCGTFFKLAAIQHQARLDRKTASSAERGNLIHHSDTHDQMTQTSRPLPRTPTGGRSHGHGHRHSHHRGEGSAAALVQNTDIHRVRPMSDSQIGPMETSLDLSPPLSVSQLGDESRSRPEGRSRDENRQRDEIRPVDEDRLGEQNRPRAGDRPSVENPPDLTSFENAPNSPPFDDNEGHTPFENIQGYDNVPSFPQPATQIPTAHFDISRRSRTFQTPPTTEKNSERHISFIEVKSPPKPPRESLHGWTTHEHLGTFTGGNPTTTINPNGTLERERGVVLGVNSLRRHKDRDQHPRFFTTPAPCSEDSLHGGVVVKSLKEDTHSPKEQFSQTLPRDGGSEVNVVDPSSYYSKPGIRTAPPRGSKANATVVIVNAQEETTRL